jgi:hypothetical protein
MKLFNPCDGTEYDSIIHEKLLEDLKFIVEYNNTAGNLDLCNFGDHFKRGTPQNDKTTEIMIEKQIGMITRIVQGDFIYFYVTTEEDEVTILLKGNHEGYLLSDGKNVLVKLENTNIVDVKHTWCNTKFQQEEEFHTECENYSSKKENDFNKGWEMLDNFYNGKDDCDQYQDEE